ncbi:MAG: nucleotidyltransferase family protein [Chitinophagaceae bacterium]|nr:nucleotidyltransferase family protein [Chitinophagaceae bacterium]
MILEKDFEEFIQLLNKHSIEYLVVGGYALAFHGRPRHTGDLDIWIKISEKNASKLIKVISEFGMSSLQISKEDFLKEGYMTQIGYPPLRIDILNSIDGVGFDEAYKNRQVIEEAGLNILYIGLEDLIKNKKAAGRKQDIADIAELKKKKKN